MSLYCAGEGGNRIGGVFLHDEIRSKMLPSPWLILIAGGAGLGGLLLLALSALLIYKLVHARQGYSSPNSQTGNVSTTQSLGGGSVEVLECLVGILRHIEKSM